MSRKAVVILLLLIFISPVSSSSFAWNTLNPIKSSQYPHLNSLAVEYYDAPSSGTSITTDAARFDWHMGPHNLIGLKAVSPSCGALIYTLWREQYVSDDPGAVADRVKMSTWCTANGKNIESFYCHYGRDVSIESNGYSKIIPGFTPANDVNGDGIRDWKSDYGTSTRTGNGYLQDSSKNWISDEWAGCKLVDHTGSVFTITSNTNIRLSFSGRAQGGRYSLSHAGAPVLDATAHTKVDARVQAWIWQDWTYALNLGGADYQAFRAYDAVQTIVHGNTSWDSQASVLWDGIMIDNCQPDFPWATVTDGNDSVLEYPDKSAWRADQVVLAGIVKAAIGGKVLMPNTGSYSYQELADVCGGQHQEQYIAATNEHPHDFWDYWKQQSDKGIYILNLASWDCWWGTPDSDRERMHYLAYHYMGQEPYVYLGFRGTGYTDPDIYGWEPTAYDWFAAAEYDVGTPAERYHLVKSGTDGRGQSYEIYERKYTRALIVCRPKIDWSHGIYDTSTAVTYNLPYYSTGTGTSNEYRKLNIDGTLSSTTVTSVPLRNVESFILIPANTPVYTVTCDSAKLLPDGSNVVLQDAVVTYVNNSTVYVEKSDRSAAFKATGAIGITTGDRVTITGYIRTGESGEREIHGSVEKLSSGNPVPRPLYMPGAALIGGPYGMTPGVTGGTGCNTSGLLVRICGRVTSIGMDANAGYVYLDDGSGITDGTSWDSRPNTGIRVKYSPAASVGDCLTITGICASFMNNSHLCRLVLAVD